MELIIAHLQQRYNTEMHNLRTQFTISKGRLGLKGQMIFQINQYIPGTDDEDDTRQILSLDLKIDGKNIMKDVISIPKNLPEDQLLECKLRLIQNFKSIMYDQMLLTLVNNDIEYG